MANTRLGGTWAGLMVSALALTACSITSSESQPPAHEQTNPVEHLGANGIGTYVALGDSFASMASRAGAQRPDDPVADFCRRSPDNYPAIVAELLGTDTAIDRSCQGAIIDNLSETREAGGVEVPAQLNALRETEQPVELVTLTIGGNDIGFGELVWCAQTAMHTGEPSNCSTFLDRKVAHEIGVVSDRLDQVFQALENEAPQARVIMTGYLPLLAAWDDCAEIAAISGTDRTWLQSVTHQLNHALAEAAHRNGAEFVLPDDVDKHTVCAQPQQRWVDLTGIETGSFPFHPTVAGQAAMGREIHQRVATLR